MQPIAVDVAALWSVLLCMLGTPVSPANTDEPIEMPLGGRLVWTQGTVNQMAYKFILGPPGEYA